MLSGNYRNLVVLTITVSPVKMESTVWETMSATIPSMDVVIVCCLSGGEERCPNVVLKKCSTYSDVLSCVQ